MARSVKGAQGLMQLMPETAEKLQVENVWDPRQNIDGGTRYLQQMIAKFNGNIFRALAAYNAGPNSIINNEIPDYTETRDYINKVIKYYKMYSDK
jgi:soluble lytic murein transglycosylase-like protein